MQRRHFLQRLGLLPLMAQSGTLFAAPAAPARLLLVFLRGGYDAANLLIPVSSPFYYEARPNIAIARPSDDANSAISLTGDWGLHPALRDSVYPLYQSGQAAFIPFAGTDDLSRSHFETQDRIELGQAAGAPRQYQSGFLNRLAVELNGAGGSARSEAGSISFTQQLPIILQGSAQVANVALRSVGKSGVDARQSDIIASMYRGTALARPVADGFAVRNDILRDMELDKAEMIAANRNAISTRGFESEARRMAHLMREKYRIGFVDVGGWDTHVGQGAAKGALAGRFEELGRGLAGFAEALGPAWQDTVVVVVSEFGRTFRENGNRGTDHGHGSVFWVLGGSIHGGRVAGEQVQVAQSTLFQNRDYPVLNDYRAVLGGLFQRMYGLNSSQLNRVFPAAKAGDLGLI